MTVKLAKTFGQAELVFIAETAVVIERLVELQAPDRSETRAC